MSKPIEVVHVIEVPAQRGLDPLTIYAHNLGDGRGKLTVCCFGSAWTAYWGAMGCDDVREFAAACNTGYLHDSLIWGLNQLSKPTVSNKAYLMKVTVAVHAALQTKQETHLVSHA